MSLRSRAPTKVWPSVAPARTGILQRDCACGRPADVCAECRDTSMGLQRCFTGERWGGAVPYIVHDVLRAGGEPLDPATRVFMESHFEHDFSRVRIHADPQAAASARAVEALAYTVGHDVVFATGQYAPRTGLGRRLLAHELTHVVQNRELGAGGPLEIGPSTSDAEAEARDASTAMHVPARHNTGVVLQRQPQGTNEPQVCAGWTCVADLSACDRPDPGKEGNGLASAAWTLTVMIDVDVPTTAEVGPTTFGHSYVKFNESNGAEYTYGFYPRTRADVSVLGTRPTPSCTVHPDLTHAPCIDYRESYSLSKAEYDKALDLAKLWCHSNPSYHLYDLNCTTFVAKISEAAGKSLPQYRGKVSAAGVTADNPNTLLESLQARDKAKGDTPEGLAREIVGMIRFYQDRWVFSRLNRMWMVVMLDTLEHVHRMKYLDHLIEFFSVAQDVNKPRLMTAMRAVKLKTATGKPSPPQVDEILAIAPDLPDQQKREIRAYLGR